MRHALRSKLYLVLLMLGVGAVGLTLCGCTTYNVYFEDGSFRVAESLTVEPGQGGDDTGGPTASGSGVGGQKMSPGGSNVLDGFAQQGNVIQIGGSETTPTTTADIDATVTP